MASATMMKVHFDFDLQHQTHHSRFQHRALVRGCISTHRLEVVHLLALWVWVRSTHDVLVLRTERVGATHPQDRSKPRT